MLCWPSVSRSSLGKCQTLTYIDSCLCWAVALPSTEQIVSKLSPEHNFQLSSVDTTQTVGKFLHMAYI